MEKYYFVSYMWWFRGRSEEIHYENILTDEHPLTWIISTKKRDVEVYKIISYQEITKEEFDKYEDEFN